jgi:hypothetical protein
MKMKTDKLKIRVAILLMSLLTLSMTHTASAQARVGIKGGLNVSNMYIDNIHDENARYGFNVGLYGQILSSDFFAVQPELLYSTKGSKAFYQDIGDQTVKYNFNYIDLPVLAVFKLGRSAEIHVGPYVSYLLNANISYSGDVINGDDEIDKDDLKSYDYGLTGGFGLNFGPMQAGVRYNYGLVKIADNADSELYLGDSKNSVAQIYLSLNFRGREDNN